MKICALKKNRVLDSDFVLQSMVIFKELFHIVTIKFLQHLSTSKWQYLIFLFQTEANIALNSLGSQLRLP